jgi:hypothetical protein
MLGAQDRVLCRRLATQIDHGPASGLRRLLSSQIWGAGRGPRTVPRCADGTQRGKPGSGHSPRRFQCMTALRARLGPRLGMAGAPPRRRPYQNMGQTTRALKAELEPLCSGRGDRSGLPVFAWRPEDETLLIPLGSPVGGVILIPPSSERSDSAPAGPLGLRRRVSKGNCGDAYPQKGNLDAPLGSGLDRRIAGFGGVWGATSRLGAAAAFGLDRRIVGFGGGTGRHFE